MKISIYRGVAYVEGKRQRTIIPLKFLLLLVYTLRSEASAVAGSRARAILRVSEKSLRTTVHRALLKIERDWGLQGSIEYSLRTAGPWKLSEKAANAITIQFEGRNASLEDIADFIAIGSHHVSGAVTGTEHFSADTTDQLFPTQVEDIVRSDRYFADGDIEGAHVLLQQSLRAATVSSDGLMRAVCLQRLVQIYRANENHRSLLLTCRRLKHLSKTFSTPHYRKFFASSSDIAYAWYLYTHKQNYALAEQILGRTNLTELSASTLRISWLNIQSLIDRRRVLSEIRGKRDGGIIDSRVKSALEKSKMAIYEGLLLNSPYHLQQVTANLANIISVFLHDTNSLNALSAECLKRDMVRLLSCSDAICQLFDFGKDDLYNAIFTLGICRRLQINFQELVAMSKEVAPEWLNSKMNRFDGLAEYGDIEFKTASSSKRGFGSEQRFRLSFEVAWRSVIESNFDLFERYCEIFSRACWTKEGRQGVDREDMLSKIAELTSLVRERFIRKEKWMDAAECLRAI
jgi:hypothetical protein